MQLFRFENPEYLYLLLLLPALGLLWWYARWRRKNILLRIGNSELVSGLMAESSVLRLNIKISLQLLAIISTVLILSRPQFGSKIEEAKRKGVEIIIALDVSNSMMAEDIQPNRLERAKQAISRLVDRMEDDKIGLIVFAGDAYTQIPVTTDYVSAKMFLGSISPDIIPKQGTSIAAAIDLSMSSFSPQMDESKAIIIITDGENHEDDPVKMAQQAAEKGIVIHTIGIGSVQGVPIPVGQGNRREFLTDHEGNTVISKLDEESLKKIAFAANGKYVRASNTTIGLNTIFEEISNMKKQDLDGSYYTEYDDQFQLLAAFALLLLVIEFMIMERKNRNLGKIRLFDIKI